MAERPSRAKRSWSTDEEAELRGRSGWESPEYIARALHRTTNAVIVRQKRLGISRVWKGAYTAMDVGRIFGVDSKTVVIWIRHGWLAASKSKLGAGQNRRWRIEHEAIEAFIREHPARYERRRIPLGSYWRECADTAAKQQADLVTVAQAASILQVTAETLRRHLRRGWLVGEKVPWAGGTIWLIPRAALDSFVRRRTSFGPGRESLIVEERSVRTGTPCPGGSLQFARKGAWPGIRRCPVCQRVIAVHRSGRLYRHNLKECAEAS